ncbi:haloacid dehalogenase type II [Marinobacter sp. ELB17]|uniref:haloacid dehalogenase type II n=1 Tax=Marinobacter sp. ELB17 TaxID=270374 RepID=UPI0000F3B57D|nr:haloacid dehalogenase type II [Marinobacter sp. ELB17]EAZ97521.1 probable Haloacid dehalogenase, type II [Marinobacter sp. ELB17]
MPQRVIVFDVNETLLDLGGLDQPFQEVFGDTQAKSQWFAQLLNLALTVTIVEDYRDFSALGRTALELVAARHGLRLAEGQIKRILEQMQHLSPHADARPSLERLQAAGFRLAALTNSIPVVAQAQLHNAGLAPFFEAILSVDETRRFKPAPEPYRMAAQRLQVNTSDLRMVAVHDWDVIGAMAAGCQGAFVARGGIAFNALAPQPDVFETTLEAIAETIVRVDG